jgi:hypothetical protein
MILILQFDLKDQSLIQCVEIWKMLQSKELESLLESEMETKWDNLANNLANFFCN